MALLKNLCVIVAGFGLLTQGAQAQNPRDLNIHGQTDTRATAALTIPLGATPRSRESKARLDFTFSTQRLGQSQSVTPLRVEPDFQRPAGQAAKLSFTIENNPRLLLNEQRVATFGPRLTADEEQGGGGLGTAGWVVIGAGVIIGSGVLLAGAIVNDLEDAFGIDD